MNPDTLRLLKNGDNEHDAEIDAHADAWEAETEATAIVRENLRLCAQGARNNRDRADLFKRERDASEEECDALRQRLEAARPFVETAAEEAFTGPKWAELAQAWLDDAAGESGT